MVIKADPDAGQALSRPGRLRVSIAGLCRVVLSLTIGKKLSSTFFDARAIFILCLCFALYKPAISYVIKLCNCLVNIIGTVLSLSPDPH